MTSRRATKMPFLLLPFALLGADAAIAQQPTAVEGITVMAPRITYRIERQRGSAVPVKVTLAEQSAVVDIADLDLARTADLYTTEERVSEAARTLCEDLTRQFPDGSPSTAVCTRRAIDDAMEQVYQVARATPRD